MVPCVIDAVMESTMPKHHAVRRGEAHAVADAFAVVHDVVMREHDALREAGRSGGVLHVADVVWLHLRCHLPDQLDRDERRARHRFFHCERASFAETDGDDVPEEGQALRVERFFRRLFTKLRAELVYDRPVVGIQRGFDHHECMRIGLA